MKKILLVMMAALAITMTADAQRKMSRDEQANVMINFMRKFVPVDKRYAIINFPVTLYEYEAMTGTPVPYGKSVNNVAIVSGAEQKRVADELTKADGQGIKYRVGTMGEAAAGSKVGVHGELSQTSHVTKGFYIAISYNDYLKVEKMLKLIGEEDTPNAFSTGPIKVGR